MSVSSFNKLVIDEVIKNLRTELAGEGIDEAVLLELQKVCPSLRYICICAACLTACTCSCGKPSCSRRMPSQAWEDLARCQASPKISARKITPTRLTLLLAHTKLPAFRMAT